MVPLSTWTLALSNFNQAANPLVPSPIHVHTPERIQRCLYCNARIEITNNRKREFCTKNCHYEYRKLYPYKPKTKAKSK